MDAETGIITTMAGVGSPGGSGDQGPAIAAQLNTPTSVTFDPTGAMYITEALGNRIRRCVTLFTGAGHLTQMLAASMRMSQTDSAAFCVAVFVGTGCGPAAGSN